MRDVSYPSTELVADTSIRPTKDGLIAQPPASGEMRWLVAVAVAFFMVHIVAGTILMRASTNVATSSRYEEVSSLYD
jgi:hypothetical protein